MRACVRLSVFASYRVTSLGPHVHVCCVHTSLGPHMHVCGVHALSIILSIAQRIIHRQQQRSFFFSGEHQWKHPAEYCTDAMRGEKRANYTIVFHKTIELLTILANSLVAMRTMSAFKTGLAASWRFGAAQNSSKIKSPMS